jgi:DNA-binding beta-propeller fold protein YncE
VQTVSGGSFGFNAPYGITDDGSNLWVTNAFGNSVTELSGSGSWIQTLSGGSYAFNEPTFAASDGTDVWVTDEAGNSVTEVQASDGSWVATYT